MKSRQPCEHLPDRPVYLLGNSAIGCTVYLVGDTLMTTLQGMKDEAQDRVFTDARCSRVYKHSFSEHLKGMGLITDYDSGWERGRRYTEVAQRMG